jgi:hypothetical protein
MTCAGSVSTSVSEKNASSVELSATTASGFSNDAV